MDEISPYKLQQIWQTLNWLSKIFGLLKVDEHQRLVTKKKALEEELAPTVVRPQKKAAVPSREVIWALEEGAALGGPLVPLAQRPQRRQPPVGNATSSWMPSSWALPASQVCCSARFDDLQHVRPEELRTASNTIELPGLADKGGKGSSDSHETGPVDLPEVQLLWSTLVPAVRIHSAETLRAQAFEGMDYLLPTISKDFAGLIPRPSGGDRALRWLKDALRRRGVAQEHVTPLTWHSFRVFIPDCAFQLGVPRSERQYLGNWMTESTADVYTREKRNVVTAIWTKVADKVNSLKMTLGRERREDLNHGTGTTQWLRRWMQMSDTKDRRPGLHDAPWRTPHQWERVPHNPIR